MTLEGALEKIDNRLDYIESNMATKSDLCNLQSELTSTKALAQDAQFSSSKVHWAITGLVGLITFLVGFIIP